MNIKCFSGEKAEKKNDCETKRCVAWFSGCRTIFYWTTAKLWSFHSLVGKPFILALLTLFLDFLDFCCNDLYLSDNSIEDHASSSEIINFDLGWICEAIFVNLWQKNYLSKYPPCGICSLHGVYLNRNPRFFDPWQMTLFEVKHPRIVLCWLEGGPRVCLYPVPLGSFLQNPKSAQLNEKPTTGSIFYFG